MKYAAVAVAIAGVAAADSTLSIAWEPVDPTTSSTTWTTWDPKPTPSTTWTTWDPKDETSSTTWTTWDPKETSSTTWTTWDPKDKTSSTTWTTWDPKTTSTLVWEAYTTTTTTTTTTSSSKCSYVTAVPTTYCVPGSQDKCWSDSVTTTLYADTCTWAAWSTPATPTTTGKCSYVTEVATSKCAPGHSDWCYGYTTTETLYADTCTWDDWKTKSTPVVETSTSSWGSWEPVAETTTWEPVAETTTWAAVYDSTKTLKSTVTETSTWATWETAVVTSVVTPGWSSEGWFGGAWPTAKSGECVHNVVTSYGAPIWKPTPEASVKTETATWSGYGAVSTSYAEIKPNGKKWSLTYSPYSDSGKCKAQAAIEADIAKIASLGFTSVRVYSTDCDTLEFVGNACKAHGLTIILGVFIDKTGVNGAAKQVQDIVSWAQWEIVELIVVGNEAVFQGFCTADALVAFIKSSKAAFAKAGYSGPCTTTEPLDQWQKYGDEFCGAVDVVAANLYAFFNSECTAANAGTFIAAEIKILEGICSDKKETYVMECGWPSEGTCNGAACPGIEEQKTAILAIEEECGEQIVFFSFEDEVWKQPGQFGVEQHWGCSDVFGNGASQTWANVPAKTTTTVAATTWANVPASTKTADPTKWAAF